MKTETMSAFEEIHKAAAKKKVKTIGVRITAREVWYFPRTRLAAICRALARTGHVDVTCDGLEVLRFSYYPRGAKEAYFRLYSIGPHYLGRPKRLQCGKYIPNSQFRPLRLHHDDLHVVDLPEDLAHYPPREGTARGR